MNEEKEPLTVKLQRIFATAAAVVSIFAVLCFFIWILAVLFGLPQEALATGWWPFLAISAWIGLPTGFALVIAVLVLSWVSGDREPSTSTVEPSRRHKKRNIDKH